MKIEFTKEDYSEIAKALAGQLIKTDKPAAALSLDDWIRAERLEEKGLFSMPTIRKYHKKGLIGKSTIGGTVCYYIPDILGLLKMNYHKPEAIEKISNDLKNRNHDKL